MNVQMIFVFAVICAWFGLILGTADDVADEKKRLVLHSDADIAAELLLLKQQLAAQSQLMQDMAKNFTAEVEKMKQQLSSHEFLLEDTKNKRTGSTYVRWGRTSCSGSNATLVYTGYMAGTYYDRPGNGAGANYLCLSDSPQWDYSTSSEDMWVFLTGVEYNFNPHHISDLAQFLGHNVYLHQAPCAVCHLPSATTLMIPGRTECYPGWNKEYSGYIVTGNPGYPHGTEYVCLDRRPESVVGCGKSDGGNLLYFVEAKCQFGLECPPYENGREFACVVCSNTVN